MTEEIATPASQNPAVALLLSFLAPGLGLIYAGHLLWGVFVNLLYVLLVLCFLVAASIFKFFPVYPAMVLLMAWLLLSLASGLKAREIIIQKQAPRPPRAYQRPLIYALLATLTFGAPLALSADFASRYLFSVASVDSMVMYPQTHPGDRLFIDRTTYLDEGPRRGDLVALRIPDTGELAVLRVVGVPSDKIAMQGNTLMINDQLIDYTPFDPAWINEGEVDLDSDIRMWIEHNHGRRYVISMHPGAKLDASVPGLKLGADSYFVLADHRSIVEGKRRVAPDVDSRIFGPINRDHIEGRPLYIAWSSHPETGSTSWNRIGLPTH